MNSLLARKKIIFLILALFFLLEVGSFLSYYFSVINIVFFGLIVIFSLVLAIYKLEWAFYLVLGELFFNSMGYIFYLENGGFKISLRIALWIVLLSVYLAKFIIQLFKGKRGLWQKYRSILHFNGFILLGLFIVLAFVWGVLKNGFSDAFFDFNAWLYFALLLPLWHILLHKSKDQINDFWQNIIIIFVSSVAYLVFKSLFLLFFFSHNIQPLTLDIYHWTRLYGLGEVTNMGGGFYRVFLQSQIYILLAFIIFLAIWVFDFSKKTKIYLLIFLYH